MAYEIALHDEIGVSDFPEQRVTDAITHVLVSHNVPDGSALSIVLTSDEHVHELNARYRGVDAPTDVLSFPADPLPEEMSEEGNYLGDLIVAYAYTVHQAQEAGHSPDDEFVLLGIHGTLHLLGYDHDNVENQAAMWTAQSDALQATGVSLTVPLFTFDDESQ